MLQIPKKIDYAVQLLRRLSEEGVGSTVSLRDISEELHIPFSFLQQIAQVLKKNEYLGATRGATGGYFLAKEIQHTTIQDVMELFHEEVETVACSKGDHACHKSATCKVKGIWKGVNHSMKQIFENTYVLG